MSSTTRLPAPSPAFLGATGLLSALVLGYAVLVAGEVLVGLIGGSFVFVTAVMGWLLVAAVKRYLPVPVDWRPAWTAGFVGVLVVGYAVLEGAVLLGLLAALLLVFAGALFAVVLGLRSGQ